MKPAAASASSRSRAASSSRSSSSPLSPLRNPPRGRAAPLVWLVGLGAAAPAAATPVAPARGAPSGPCSACSSRGSGATRDTTRPAAALCRRAPDSGSCGAPGRRGHQHEPRRRPAQLPLGCRAAPPAHARLAAAPAGPAAAVDAAAVVSVQASRRRRHEGSVRRRAGLTTSRA